MLLPTCLVFLLIRADLSKQLTFSLVLCVLDLVQCHYSKLPHRVEAMLDLFLAFSFLSFFIIGVITLKWTMDAIFFILA